MRIEPALFSSDFDDCRGTWPQNGRFRSARRLLPSQVQLRETIRDVKALHNENLVAVAQKKYVYIYDNQGAEVRKAPARVFLSRSLSLSVCLYLFLRSHRPRGTADN